MIIVLEGIDNCGKTTTSDFLYNYLNKLGKKVIVSRELTTEVGDLIKKCIKENGLSPLVKTFLFAADRQIRLEELDNLSNKDSIYIFDRYIYSAIVYREAEGLDGLWVKEINKNVPQSDYTFFIDITPEESIKRNNDAKFNIHYTKDYLSKVRDSYLKYAESEKFIIIDGMKNARDIQKEIIDNLKKNGVI